jgi:hypothetical protein
MLENVAIIVISTLCGGIISMVGFWLTTSAKFVTKEEVEKMITSTEENFAERNNLTNYQILELKENDREIAKLVASSNQAINNLNIEVAKLSMVLNSLVKKLEYNG